MSKIKTIDKAKSAVYHSHICAASELNERGDCAVRAAAIVTGANYVAMHSLMASLGRKPRCGTHDNITKDALARYGKKMVNISPESFLTRYPQPHARVLKSVTTHHMARFNKVWADGKTYLVWTSGHILAVVNGVNHDWSRGRAARVLKIAIVINKDETAEQHGFRKLNSGNYVANCPATSHLCGPDGEVQAAGRRQGYVGPFSVGADDDEQSAAYQPPTNEHGRYIIPVVNLPELQAKLTKLNRRATRIGCEPVGYVELARRMESVSHQVQHDEGGGHQETKTREVAEIQIHGTSPRLAGWEFIGRIEVVQAKEPGSEPVTLLYAAPGKQIPQACRDQPHHCDHCNTLRIRRDTYIVAQAETGETKRVGRNCLRDFLGHKDPNQIAAFLQEIHDLIAHVRGDHSGAGWSDPMLPLTMLLPQTIAIVRVLGWMSAKQAQRMMDEGRGHPDTTATILRDIINPFKQSVGSGERERLIRLREQCAVIPQDEAAAPAVLEFMKQAGDGTDFWFNLNTVARIGASPVKQWGLLTAAVGMWFKEQGKLQAKARINNEFLPHELGAKIVLQVTLNKVMIFNNNFGDTHLHTFRDAENHAITWWSSRGKIGNEGDALLIKGTIKKFEERNGYKQTVLTRVKIVEAPQPKVKATKAQAPKEVVV